MRNSQVGLVSEDNGFQPLQVVQLLILVLIGNDLKDI